jgi:hypothetical protein
MNVQQVNMGDFSLPCDVSNNNKCPLVPEVERQAVFQAVHIVAHPGTSIWATHRIITACLVWRGIRKNAASWCRDCQQ